MGFLLECSYEVAPEKCSVAWTQALLSTARSRFFLTCKGLQAQLKEVMKDFKVLDLDY